MTTLRRAVMASAVVTAVVGTLAVWGAVDRLGDRWARHAVVQGEMADVRSVIGARLDEAVGVAGLDASFPTGDTDLQAQIDEVLTWAEVSDDDGLTNVVITPEADLVEATTASGSVDERLLVPLEIALRELDRATVRPTADAAQAAGDTARRTLLIALAVPAALAALAIWLGRRCDEAARFP
jgi:hypothetical protein